MSQDNEQLEDAMDREGFGGGVVDDEPGDSSTQTLGVFILGNGGRASDSTVLVVAQNAEEAHRIAMDKAFDIKHVTIRQIDVRKKGFVVQYVYPEDGKPWDNKGECYPAKLD